MLAKMMFRAALVALVLSGAACTVTWQDVGRVVGWEVPAPTPAPVDPAGPPAPIAVDELDPGLVSWDEPAGDVGAWPITAALSGVRITRDGMEAVRAGGDWPVIPGAANTKASIGNWWIIAQVGGRWHAATCDWLGRGKTRVTGKHWEASLDGLHGPLAAWTAAPGEQVYVLQSTPARAGVQTIRERTGIVGARVP